MEFEQRRDYEAMGGPMCFDANKNRHVSKDAVKESVVTLVVWCVWVYWFGRANLNHREAGGEQKTSPP